ncbi:translocation/assembly module TamB domain-containing protein [Mucilaginibacter sp. BT774]|uniref:translocation/assembly module TamB domain-containing protein n=1 Tax=Mucilaginibacter sp. BT774 TaxID=3062276 RepID=UPI002675A485|nr:translocation/assembly module TamB domain-containing protein [Mucilaginibacter sp. BT774]MDO3625963.1 translocation/assembly module TamB domain-containing protein [Mucilaginibacter sp. BT774]
MKRFGRIALKTALWIIGSVLFLVLVIIILIQIPGIQNFIKDKAVNYVQNKIHTKVKIGHISLGLPKLIVIDGVYMEDQRRDTLVAGDQLKLDVSLLDLLHHKLTVNEINLKGITANVYRSKDSVFNFDYIIKAFNSGPSKPANPKDTSSMKVSLDKIVLNKINIGYNDLTNGNNVKFILGHFDTRIKDFDMDKMKFSIPKITVSDIDAKIIQTPAGSSIQKAATIDTATRPINMTLNLGIIDLSRIKVDYRTNEMAANVNLGKFLLEMNKLDLKSQVVDINNISLDNTHASLTFAKPQTVKKAIVKTVKKLDTLVAKPQGGKPWSAVLRKLRFKNDHIQFDNNAQAPLKNGLDYAHMNIRDLNAELENLSYTADSSSGKINNLTFIEKSGLAIKKFHTAFFYGEHKSYLNDLYLETPQTILQRKIAVGYPSLANINRDLGKININADLDGSRLGLKDVLLVMPTMATMEPFKHSPNGVFKINGRVRGRVNDLSIPSLEITGLSNTHIKASAKMKGLPDISKAYFDVTINDFNTSRSDLAKVVPAQMIPSNVTVPENFNLKGNFKGSMANFNTKLALKSSLGSADVDAQMKNGTNKKKATYSAHVNLNQLNVGALTKQPQQLGSFTLSTEISGTGIDPKTASLQFNGDIASAYIKGYTYKNIALKGTAVNGSYTAIARMKDPNINFSLNAKANLNKKYPSVNATLEVDSINLKNLNLATNETRFHGKIEANVPTADPDYLNANIKATDIVMFTSGKRIKIDTVSLVSTSNADSSSLRLKTPMLYAHMVGKYKLTEIGAAIQDVFNQYFNRSIASKTAIAKPKYTPQQFKFDARFVKTPLVTDFAPDLKQMDPITVNGWFNSQTGDLVVNGNMPKVIYAGNEISNVKLAIKTDRDEMDYSLTADQIRASSSINLLYTSITGKAEDDKLDVNLQVRDAAKKERYRIAGIFSLLPNEYQFSFLQNGLLLDYKQWAVSTDNALQFGDKGIFAKDFTITNNNQILSINSTAQQMNAPVKVDFKNFHIETLTRIAQQDSLQVGGVINGDATISNFQKSLVFTTAMNISDFNFKGDTVGNIAIKINNQTENTFAADVGITGQGNQVDLKGLYYTALQSRFDLDLNIVKLNMKSIEGFSFGSIKEASGDITGELKITGTTAAPTIRGDVNFNKVGFNVSMLNSYFTMPRESITFNNDGIRFNDFTLVDSTGNKAIVSGTVYTSNYADYKFGVNIHSDNFRVINSTREDNQLYYGKLYLNSDIKIRGDMNSPVVAADLTVNDKTNLTIVLPSSDPSIEDRKGVVEFIDPNAPKSDSIMLARQLDSLKKSKLKGMDVNATIRVNRNAVFNIVVDQNNGDIVHIKGEAQLNGGIDPSGKTNLTGTYTVEQGSYNLSYASVNRKFIFKKGSSITWTGDPTSASINLTATYVADVPPIDLVSDQLTGTENQTMYKQKLPFNVNLTLQNDLMKPDISFDIVLPDSSYTVSQDVINTVDSRLAQIRQDPNELNKQVLGVLVLGHFIGDNPLQSQGGNAGVEGLVRNSVSSLLSDQLNRLAGNLIAGVDLNFGLTSGEDYSSGTAQNRTDLNVGLSKRFLNDRLTVSVGNNFNLEGQNQPGQKTTDIAGNVSVNYKLSKDGRYQLRAYRRDQFVVIEGEIIETGVGFTLTVDYNRFSQIFRRKTPKDKELERKYKQDQKEKDQEAKNTQQQAAN